jgi:hypothetical protein
MFRTQVVGGQLKIFNLSDELYLIKHQNSIKPIFSDPDKFKIDFNIFVTNTGRRLQPDLKIIIE